MGARYVLTSPRRSLISTDPRRQATGLALNMVIVAVEAEVWPEETEVPHIMEVAWSWFFTKLLLDRRRQHCEARRVSLLQQRIRFSD
mmetsp:Transcript_17470/g.32295  ORF Transcript_17470/g.32295 Transcript_17470/m.32295 type:complete len:87 (+) Transcript_17470:121-381(+)